MILVQKFGGTSVGDVERIKHVAEMVAARKRAGYKPVVVVSAMGDTTDDLIALARRVTQNPNVRECDMLLSTGEQVSAALLAMALQDMGIPAVSLTGWQAGIKTDSAYSKAKILSVDTTRILAELNAGKVVVVTGFQGVDCQNNITTLGRGGSDMTAVALASALKVDTCEIFTDVPGVFSADPRVVPDARLLESISYAEMIELASLGAQVLQSRSVEYAEKLGIKIRVLSSFEEGPGTFVRGEEYVNDAPVRGVACDFKVAKIAVTEVPDRPGIAYQLFSKLAEYKIVVDMIIQSVSRDGINDISFTVPEADLDEAVKIAKQVASSIGAKGVVYDSDVCKVSVVGLGVATNTEIPAKMFGAMAAEGINIEMISTSETRISCIVRARDGERAVRAIHDAFKLGTRC